MNETIPEWAATARVVGTCKCADAGRYYTETLDARPVYDSPPLDARAAIKWALRGGVPGRLIGYTRRQVSREVTCSTCGRLLAVG